MSASRIVLLRHGQTDFNLARRFQGRIDQPLNEAGRSQAAGAAGVLVSRLCEPSAEVGMIAAEDGRSYDDGGVRIVSSPLGRAVDTARIIARVFDIAGYPCEGPALDERLTERFYGSFEGKTYEEIAAEQAEAARKAGTSDRAADLDALRRDEAIANRGLSEEDALVAARERQKGAAGQGASQTGSNRAGASVSGSAQGDAAGHADRKGAQSAHSAADIVAANPSISADQLKQMHAAEASLARATAGSAPGVVDAGAASSDQESADRTQSGPAMIDHRTDARGTGAADQELAGEGAGQRTGKEGQPAAQAGSAQGSGKASSDPDARRGWQTAVIEAAGSNHGTRVPATLPATVRTADGFAPMALSTENAAQLGKPCEQPIEMCGKQVFETLFPVQASTLAALPVNQSRRESFIYADGPVTSAVYLVTMANLPDDSIASQRIRIEFVRRGAGWVAASAGRQFKCREGELVRQQWTDRSCR